MRVLALSLIAAVGAGSAALAADVPVVKPFTAPPPGPQYFLWLEGGYSAFDLTRIHGVDLDVVDTPIYFDIDDGWFGRGEAGFIPAQRIGLIDAISVAVGYRRGSSDIGPIAPAEYGYNFPTNQISHSRDFGVAEQEFSLFDLQLRLKHAPVTWTGFTINLEPFFARAKHNASTTLDNIGGGSFQRRTGRVDADIFGIQGAIEGTRRVSDTLALRGRLSLGAYHLDADADFTNGPAIARTNSYSRSLSGLRAGADIGADFALTPNLILGLTAGADYWSEMPFPQLTSAGPPSGPLIGIGSDNFVDYFVGVRLTLATGAR